MDLLGTVCFHLLLVLPCLLGESRAIHWTGSLRDDEVIHPCKDSNVTLPWKYQLDGGDTVTDVEWYFDGKSQEVVGIFIHGQFLTYPAFSGRVSPTENAGITLTGLLPGDSGNYSVVVKGHQGSDHYFELKKTVTLHVSGHTMNYNGPLHVSQSVEPVMDTASGQWAVQLICGQFTFNGQPTYDVQWIFPDGLLHNSSSFDGANFSVLLTSPVRGGSYTCRVPRQHSCVNGQGRVTAEASIMVDALDARLTLLEKVSALENQRLRIEKERLEQRLNHTDRRLENVTGELRRVSQENVELHQLNGTIGELSTLLEREQRRQKDTDRRLDSVVKENRHLEQLIQHLNGSVGHLKEFIETEQLAQNQTDRGLESARGQIRQLTDSSQQLFQQNVQLQQHLNATTAQLNRLKETASKTVSFHASYWNDKGAGGGDPMILTNTLNNQGNAYDRTTGLFTAPYPGVYAFFGKTRPEIGAGWINLYIYTNTTTARGSSDNLVDYVSVYQADPPAPSSSSPMAAVQAVIHLDRGDTAWIVCRWGVTIKPFSYNTMFSGFLVSPD